jgi:hypothetical protein
VYRGLQNCADVLDPVCGLCTDTSPTAFDIKVEEFSGTPVEEDPLAGTSPAIKTEQEVSNVYITCECWNSNDASCGIRTALCVWMMSA